MSDIDFHYDVVCPYAYLGALKIKKETQKIQAKIRWIPTLLGGLFRYNQSPDIPAQTWAPAKLRYSAIDLVRQAQKQQKKLRYHPQHPVRSVEAMRLLCMVNSEIRPLLSIQLFSAYWEQGQNISDPKILNNIAKEVGIDVDLFLDPKAKEKLFDNTKLAHERGIFGVPSFAVGDRIWWGQDRLHLAMQSLGAPKKQFPEGRASTDPISLYHDFSSPFSYLGVMQIPKIEEKYGITIQLKPILLGALFRNIGTPDVPLFAMSKAKQNYMLRDLNDGSKFWNTPFSFPKKFPIRSILPLRISILAPQCTFDIYSSMWEKGEDISDPEVLKKIVTNHNLNWNDLLENIAKAKKILIENTTEAEKKGICGVPSFHFQNSIWWGQDRILDLLDAVIS